MDDDKCDVCKTRDIKHPKFSINKYDNTFIIAYSVFETAPLIHHDVVSFKTSIQKINDA